MGNFQQIGPTGLDYALSWGVVFGVRAEDRHQAISDRKEDPTMERCEATGVQHTPRRADRFTWECTGCGRKTTPMHPNLVATEIGPRKVGVRYREDGRTLVEVIEVEPVSFDMSAAWSVTVRDLDGPTVGRIRRHCTSWTMDRNQLVHNENE